MTASPVQVPRALTHAYEQLIEVLRANRVNHLAKFSAEISKETQNHEADSSIVTFLDEMSASTRSAFDLIENPDHVCVAVDRFVYRYCLREDWNSEFIRRVEYLATQCGVDSVYDQAKNDAIAAVVANWSKSQAQEGLKRLRKYDPPVTVGDLWVEAWLPKRFLEGDQFLGPVDATAHPALKKWQDECQRIMLEADCIEAHGCWNMYHIYLASRPNPPDPPESLRELLGAREFPKEVPDGGLLDSVESAVVALMDFADVSDTKPDKGEKPEKKKRLPSKAAVAVAKMIRHARRAGDTLSKKAAINAYLDENKGSYSTIDRELSDNPELWKNPTNTRQKPDT